MSEGIRVTVEDLESGETTTREILNDYILVTAGDHYLDGFTKHANGTVQLVIKRSASNKP